MFEVLSRPQADDGVRTANLPPWKRIKVEYAAPIPPRPSASIARFKAIRAKIEAYERATATCTAPLGTS